MSVSRLSFPLIMVMGPAHVFNACLVCSFTKRFDECGFSRSRGPHTTITVGATPESLRIVAATSFRWDRSAFRCKLRLLLPRFATPKARVLCFPLLLAALPEAVRRPSRGLGQTVFPRLCLALLWSAMIDAFVRRGDAVQCCCTQR